MGIMGTYRDPRFAVFGSKRQLNLATAVELLRTTGIAVYVVFQVNLPGSGQTHCKPRHAARLTCAALASCTRTHLCYGVDAGRVVKPEGSGPR